MKENVYFKCPRCGSILNNQEGFDSLMPHWTCIECGTSLEIAGNNSIVSKCKIWANKAGKWVRDNKEALIAGAAIAVAVVAVVIDASRSKSSNSNEDLEIDFEPNCNDKKVENIGSASLPLAPMGSGNYPLPQEVIEKFNDYSPLYKRGYRVGVTNPMSEDERHKIIDETILENDMTALEVCNHLKAENSKHQNQHNFAVANDERYSDMKYIRDTYDI